uniref:AT02038p n=2 Tax=Drosophila melanogaster TaxID=7227 RepID=Q8T4E7_DROME|nr:uncharacterized protein Dmel_CG13088 [Drosophila melanogaster]AAF52684.2 uncharacterized protein Dmel_CG13088 [Drosophila melanogaster]AAL89963.1 AT02038p [Drosophila melanogaster]AAO39648.1 AT13284p [Drosophila melanogaster]AOQ14286.1 CG13088-PA [synthetic construct]|eukprot:NP_609234.2 uncharacterized protein Dmel_CG13088 [Drosophila melanogaster]
MEQINEDVWIDILKYLPMRDQLSLVEVNENISAYVKYHWSHLKTVTLTREDLDFLDRNNKLMHECLGGWSATVERLNLQSASSDLLRKWTEYDFPHLRSLDCHMDYNLEEADEETLLLTELFPLLTRLSLNSSTTGRYLWHWKQLRELNLTWCEYLDPDHFEEIFGNLQLTKLTMLYYGYNVNLGEKVVDITRCTTLEELHIDDHHLLGDFLPRLMNLPHFRRLAFYTRDYYEYLLGSVARHKPLKVQSLLFNDSFWSSERVAGSILHMTNLRRLVLQEDDIDAQQLHTICHKLPNLEELHLLAMREVPSPSHLWNSIGHCHLLRILNLSSTKLVDLRSSCLTKVLLSRRIPLTLHLHNTGLDPSKVLRDFDSASLKISFEPIHLNIWSPRFVEIEFSPDS